MGIIYTIFILGIVWYGYKYFFTVSPAKLIEQYETFAQSMLGAYRTTNKVSYGQEEDPPELLRMMDWYTRLKEKYKHDQLKLVHLAEDWKDYTYCLLNKNTSNYIYLNGEDSEEGEEKLKEARGSHLRIEEIENRFADMLNPQQRQELEAERKKKDEEADAFWKLEE